MLCGRSFPSNLLASHFSPHIFFSTITIAHRFSNNNKSLDEQHRISTWFTISVNIFSTTVWIYIFLLKSIDKFSWDFSDFYTFFIILSTTTTTRRRKNPCIFEIVFRLQFGLFLLPIVSPKLKRLPISLLHAGSAAA